MSMSPHTRTRWRRARAVLTRHHVPEALAWTLCIGSTLLGVVFILDRTDIAAVPSWEPAFDVAGPAVWGALLIVPSIATMLSLAARRRDVWWPMLAITTWYTAWSVAGVWAVPDPRTIATGIVAYGMLLALSAILTLSYMTEGRT